MKKLVFGLALAFNVAGSPIHAQSSGLGQSSDNHVSVRVIIPPMGAILQAMRLNAVGAWTVNEPGQGLMVRVPDRITVGSTETADLFFGSDVLVEASFAAGSPLVMGKVDSKPMNGLDHMRIGFGAHETQDDSALLLIRSL